MAEIKQGELLRAIVKNAGVFVDKHKAFNDACNRWSLEMMRVQDEYASAYEDLAYAIDELIDIQDAETLGTD